MRGIVQEKKKTTNIFAQTPHSEQKQKNKKNKRKEKRKSKTKQREIASGLQNITHIP